LWGLSLCFWCHQKSLCFWYHWKAFPWGIVHNGTFHNFHINGTNVVEFRVIFILNLLIHFFQSINSFSLYWSFWLTFTSQISTLGTNDTWVHTWINKGCYSHLLHTWTYKGSYSHLLHTWAYKGSYSHLLHTLMNNIGIISTNQWVFIILIFLFVFWHHMKKCIRNLPLAIPFAFSYHHLSHWLCFLNLWRDFLKSCIC
jgi:hypothetical protein